MSNPQMSTLQEVKAWLQPIAPGSTVEVEASMFRSDLVASLFGLLTPGSEPISLEVQSADPEAARLTGTSTVLEEAGTVTFQFSQAPSELVLELTLTPTAAQWSLLAELHLVFEVLSLRFVPNPEVGIVDLVIAATAVVEGKGGLKIPVELAVPSFAGDWHLTAGKVEIGELTADALEAIAGNNSLLAALPPEGFQELSRFSLTGFEAAFEPEQETCSMIRVGLGYDARWKFFDDQFEVEEIDLEFTIFEPFHAPNVQARLAGKMKVAGKPFEVGGLFPDKAVFAQLGDGAALNVAQVLEFMQVTPPSGFPRELEITALDFVFFTADGSFTFQLGIDKPFAILGKAHLESFLFDLEVTHEKSGFSAAGDLHSRISIGDTALVLTGTYRQGGVTLEGEVYEVAIEDLVTKLEEEFEVAVPAPLKKLDLKKLSAKVDSAKHDFCFECEGTTTVSDVEVDLTASIELAHSSAGFKAKFSGVLVLTVDKDEKLEFDVAFSTDTKDTSITAGYKGEVLKLEDLAKAIGFPLPEIPQGLDLDLEAVGLFYDFTAKALVVGGKSRNYGSATLVTLPLENKRRFFFILDTGKEFSLSNLPLVGHDLAQVENVSISQLQLIIATAAVDATQAAEIDKQIGGLGSAQYPQLPKSGIEGTFLLSAQLSVGSELLPLDVSLGGNDAKELTAAEGEPGRELAPAGPGVPAWFDVQKSFGPVSIQRIGVMYQSQEKTLWFELDADLAFGPLAFSLAGLGVGSPLSTFSPSFSLQGLGVAFDKPPLEIAGGLVNLAPPGAPYIKFEGGLTVSTSTFTLQAFGYYGNDKGFPSMFAFGDVAYPFGGPPPFFITGVALGFGYNSSLRTPTIDEVGSFPFLAVLPTSTAPHPDVFGANPTPLDVLEVIRGQNWVEDKAGSLWFAAGLTFTSFELVKGQALATVELGEELVIALVGVAAARFPQDSGSFANLDLDILLRLAPKEGVFSAQAQLAKSSFLLDPACVLTGGFAFFIWFGDNPNAGDFVLTVGGYAPGYTPPPHYPSVPVVGFHWSVSDSITVSGGAYLAATPGVLMAGGRLEATYQAGNLKAWFDAHADVLIRWKPFWIDAAVGITIGASYKVNLLFTSFTVSVELGCELELWGPSTGGAVTVDWTVISFTIGFGAEKPAAPRIKNWAELAALLPNTAAPDQPRNVLGLTPVDGLLAKSTSPAPGPAAEGDQPPAPNPWTVRGSRFAFDVSTSIPASKATVGTAHAFDGAKFEVHPLDWKGVSSALSLEITDEKGEELSSRFEAKRVTRSVPASLWGSPPEGPDGSPQPPAPGQQLVADQLSGISVQARPPEIGASAGPIDVAANLSTDDLGLPGAELPLSGSAEPSGDLPAHSRETIATIADPAAGIASTKVAAARTAIYDGLREADYVPAGWDHPVADLAAEIDCALAAEPLLVS